MLADLLRRLTSAPAALVVNNNAAGTLLALTALARGREVIVSRGQLVEIGGSFRMPDVMRLSGARMVEVGTTNRTRLGDYEDAYPYDLSDSDDLTDFNIEQQASIIEDFWRVARTPPLPPLNNTGTNKSLATYSRYADQVRSAGPPRRPPLLNAMPLILNSVADR